MLSRLLTFLYFLEAGLLLAIVPWTVFWERNYFIEGTMIGHALTPHWVRGAISGVGVVCIVAALAELWSLRPWRGGRLEPSGRAEPAEPAGSSVVSATRLD